LQEAEAERFLVVHGRRPTRKRGTASQKICLLMLLSAFPSHPVNQCGNGRPSGAAIRYPAAPVTRQIRVTAPSITRSATPLSTVWGMIRKLRRI
jgi:hypothetical protein